MTAVVSRERAARTGLTAAAGMLMIAVAFVMMVAAAPVHGHIRVQQARPSAVRLTDDAVPSAHVEGEIRPRCGACRVVRPPLAGALLEAAPRPTQLSAVPLARLTWIGCRG